MKNKFDILLAIASWEERFYLGINKNLSEYEIKDFFCFSNSSTPYPEETNSNISLIKGVDISKINYFDFGSTLETWNQLSNKISKNIFYKKKVLFDITTCPRELIWYILYFLKFHSCEISYIYHKPDTYPTRNDWLTKDTRRPRFIIKHSGIAEFGKATGLFILTGFDPNRTEQLINFYEPKFILLAEQESNSLDTDNINEVLHEELVKKYKNIEVFKLNCYDESTAFNIIIEKIEKYLNDYNFIMTSLGPKPSAITVYKVFLKHPEIALSYARSNEYNIDYSKGIGDYCFGKLS